MSESELLVIVRGRIDGEPITYGHVGSPQPSRYILEFLQEKIFGAADDKIEIHKSSYIGQTMPDDLDIFTRIVDAGNCHWENSQLVMPLRIHMAIETNCCSWAEIESKISKRELKRDEKWRANKAYSWRLTHNGNDYADFYKSMVAPSMARFHGSRSRMLSLDAGREEVFNRGGLFLIEKNGVPIAGSVAEIDHENHRLTGRIIGVLDGDPSLRGDGAQNALYHLLIRWGWQNSIRVVDFGNCESFLSKGTFQYKMRFGTKAILPPNHRHANLRVLLRWRARSRAIRKFLVNNPAIVIRPTGAMGVAYFEDPNDPSGSRLGYLPTSGLEFEDHRLLDTEQSPRNKVLPWTSL